MNITTDAPLTNRRPARPKATAAQRSSLVAAGLASADPMGAKEQRYRRWACKIVSNLPSSADDAQRVLDLAGELLRGWASANTTRRPSPIGSDAVNELHFRRWACQIVSNLPAALDDAERTLALANDLLRGWSSQAISTSR